LVHAPFFLPQSTAGEMVKRAIISDIHGNLEALEAVLQDIAQFHVDEIICLGDIVGYGPNPRECIDRVMGLTACLLGNHDQGALFDPEGFSSSAERAIFWTRSQLELTQPALAAVDLQSANKSPISTDKSAQQGTNGDFHAAQLRRWNYLSQLPRFIRKEQSIFVHGSPRHPLTEYVFPEDSYNRRKMERLFALVPQYCFQGHTHVPGVFTTAGEFLRPESLLNGMNLGADKVMVNVGSVGQPRDGDPRSCYVLMEDNVVHFRRVPYPVEITVAKIYAIEALDRFLGDRLLRGQ
jgi:predicted phosphodiesterase